MKSWIFSALFVLHFAMPAWGQVGGVVDNSEFFKKPQKAPPTTSKEAPNAAAPATSEPAPNATADADATADTNTAAADTDTTTAAGGPQNEKVDVSRKGAPPAATGFSLPYQTVLDQCKTRYQAELKQCEDAYEETSVANAANTENVKLENENARRGIFDKAFSAGDAFDTAQATLKTVDAACQAKRAVCSKECNPSLLLSTPLGPEQTQAKAAMTGLSQQCLKEFNIVSAKLDNDIKTGLSYLIESKKITRSVATGALLGTAAVTGVALHVERQKDKKHRRKARNERREREQAESDFQKGMAINEDGEQISCLQPVTYTHAECRPVLLNFCGKSENAGKPACGAFNDHYCSQEGAAQSYCLASSAKKYCNQPGFVIGQSPACQWMYTRPKSCSRSPEALECLSKDSPETLAKECPKYPNDPLCKAYGEGKVVLQPSEGSTSGPEIASNSGLDSLIDNRAPASGSTPGDATTARGGSAGMASQHSSAFAELCKSGSLINCPQ